MSEAAKTSQKWHKHLQDMFISRESRVMGWRALAAAVKF